MPAWNGSISRQIRLCEVCIKVFDGRWPDGRRVQTFITDGTQKSKKSRKQDGDKRDEKARLEDFNRFIESEQA
ncbi:uncharacterized protein BDZ99DRAFT_465346 [Mytilinidion resinicola]|uniref:Uncharacterized protein n=1 Tax=Mytilinidion resinicola TaxID=574789 RepID=A0A6A6YFB1_9PEZI|nr:uncharacterized protein BDZ99DRAFT_465346 [Mytilinidion resinicola]KAF2807481.1 hypothetical protein BDZ99DRAFT_465346 [Mytilinidion resinicola]